MEKNLSLHAVITGNVNTVRITFSVPLNRPLKDVTSVQTVLIGFSASRTVV